MAQRSTNRNSRVVTRLDRRGNFRTETARRDQNQLDIAITTRPSGGTRVFIDLLGRSKDSHSDSNTFTSFELTGREARTLFIALQRHYTQTGVPSAY